VLLKRRDNFAVMLCARPAFRWNCDPIQCALSRCGDPRCVGFVGYDNGNARVRNSARVNAVGDGHEVRAASGEKNAQVMHNLSEISCKLLYARL